MSIASDECVRLLGKLAKLKAEVATKPFGGWDVNTATSLLYDLSVKFDERLTELEGFRTGLENTK